MEIITRLESLRRREHTATVALIETLVECQRTRAYADAGYDSVWKLLVARLGYSPAAASRRVAAMRCALRFPRALALLRARRTTLSALHAIANTLTSCNDPESLLDAIDGASHAEVERVVARRRPIAKPVERIRRKVVAKPPTRRAASSASELPLVDSNVSASTPAPCAIAESSTEPEERVQLTLSLTAADYERLEAAKRKLSGKYPRGMTLEQLFLELMTRFEGKPKPRSAAAAVSSSASEVDFASEADSASEGDSASEADSASKHSSAIESDARSRHVPAATRRHVFERDEASCTFVAPDGTKCASRHDLEIDHIRPWACGGTHDAANLRVLCATHNRRRAELEFGRRRR